MDKSEHTGQPPGASWFLQNNIHEIFAPFFSAQDRRNPRTALCSRLPFMEEEPNSERITFSLHTEALEQRLLGAAAAIGRPGCSTCHRAVSGCIPGGRERDGLSPPGQGRCMSSTSQPQPLHRPCCPHPLWEGFGFQGGKTLGKDSTSTRETASLEDNCH